VIEAIHLGKWYGQVIGLNDVSVSVGSGVTGLLGPNGAGKTTFLRLVTGQLKPSQGEMKVFGEPVWNNRRVLARIGFCPEEDAFYDFLSGVDFVETLARVSGVPPRDAKRRAEEAMDLVGMTAHMKRPLREYSKGMRQRTKIAQAIVHDPDVLILDEPMNGADPVGRRHLRDLIARMAAAGKQVLLSSHVLYEIEALTETIVLIHHGRMMASGNIHEIRNLMDGYPHRIAIRCDRPRDLARTILAAGHVVGVDVREDRKALTVRTADPGRFFAEFPGWALETGIDVEEMISEDDNLEAVFRYLVSK
jgi:ABC-2 type transport system ATP-binding protein